MHATILPSWQSTGGERYTFPSSAMILRSACSGTPVLSRALTLRYPYLPLEEANASATSVLSPAHLSTPSLAWRQ